MELPKPYQKLLKAFPRMQQDLLQEFTWAIVLQFNGKEEWLSKANTPFLSGKKICNWDARFFRWLSKHVILIKWPRSGQLRRISHCNKQHKCFQGKHKDWCSKKKEKKKKQYKTNKLWYNQMQNNSKPLSSVLTGKKKSKSWIYQFLKSQLLHCLTTKQNESCSMPRVFPETC